MWTRPTWMRRTRHEGTDRSTREIGNKTTKHHAIKSRRIARTKHERHEKPSHVTKECTWDKTGKQTKRPSIHPNEGTSTRANDTWHMRTKRVTTWTNVQHRNIHFNSTQQRQTPHAEGPVCVKFKGWNDQGERTSLLPRQQGHATRRREIQEKAKLHPSFDQPKTAGKIHPQSSIPR